MQQRIKNLKCEPSTSMKSIGSKAGVGQEEGLGVGQKEGLGVGQEEGLRVGQEEGLGVCQEGNLVLARKELE